MGYTPPMARQWIEWDTRFSDKPMEDESRESKVGNWGGMEKMGQ